MADEPTSPFDFSKVPGADAFGQLKSQWDSFLDQPGAKTAALQFMVNMMQPPSWGDTPASQVGRAIGSAGEAVDRQRFIEQKEAESEAKIELAGARVEAAGQRAGRAADRAGFEEERLRQGRERLDITRERNRATEQYRGLRLYNDYRKQVEALNEKGKREEPFNKAIDKNYKFEPQRILSQEEFAASPLFDQYYERAFGRRSGVPPAAAQVAPAGPAAGPASSAAPPAPANPKDRKVGQPYVTPAGVKTWFEDGWE